MFECYICNSEDYIKFVIFIIYIEREYVILCMCFMFCIIKSKNYSVLVNCYMLY